MCEKKVGCIDEEKCATADSSVRVKGRVVVSRKIVSIVSGMRAL